LGLIPYVPHERQKRRIRITPPHLFCVSLQELLFLGLHRQPLLVCNPFLFLPHLDERLNVFVTGNCLLEPAQTLQFLCSRILRIELTQELFGWFGLCGHRPNWLRLVGLWFR
jgi:hypothetical protein